MFYIFVPVIGRKKCFLYVRFNRFVLPFFAWYMSSVSRFDISIAAASSTFLTHKCVAVAKELVAREVCSNVRHFVSHLPTDMLVAHKRYKETENQLYLCPFQMLVSERMHFCCTNRALCTLRPARYFYQRRNGAAVSSVSSRVIDALQTQIPCFACRFCLG